MLLLILLRTLIFGHVGYFQYFTFRIFKGQIDGGFLGDLSISPRFTRGQYLAVPAGIRCRILGQSHPFFVSLWFKAGASSTRFCRARSCSGLDGHFEKWLVSEVVVSEFF